MAGVREVHRVGATAGEAQRYEDGRRVDAQAPVHDEPRAVGGEGEGEALALADEAVVLDVYPARERPVGRLAGVTGKLVVDAAADAAGGRPVWWLPTLDEAESMLERHLEPGTLVLTMGAGDVDELARRLVRGAASGA